MWNTEKNISLCIATALCLQSHGWPASSCVGPSYVGLSCGCRERFRPCSRILGSDASASTGVLRGVSAATSAALCRRTHLLLSLVHVKPSDIFRASQESPSVGETDKGTAYMSSGNTPDNREPRPEKKIGSARYPPLGLEVLGPLPPL